MVSECSRCGICATVCLVESLGVRSIPSLLCGQGGDSPWLCSLCRRCQQVCPHGVDIRRIVLQWRKRTRVPHQYQALAQTIRTHGYAFPFDQEIDAMRAAHGLMPLKRVPQQYLPVLLGEADETHEQGGDAPCQHQPAGQVSPNATGAPRSSRDPTHI